MSLKSVFNALVGTKEDRRAYKSLTRAVKANDTATIEKVIDGGFRPDKPVGMMWTHPLEVSLEAGTLDAFKTLLARGADPNATAHPGAISGAGTDYSLLCQSMAQDKPEFAEALLNDPRTDVRKGGRVVMPATPYPVPNAGIIKLPNPLELAEEKGYDKLAARIRERMGKEPARKPRPRIA